MKIFGSTYTFGLQVNQSSNESNNRSISISKTEDRARYQNNVYMKKHKLYLLNILFYKSSYALIERSYCKKKNKLARNVRCFVFNKFIEYE